MTMIKVKQKSTKMDRTKIKTNKDKRKGRKQKLPRGRGWVRRRRVRFSSIRTSLT